MPLIPTRKQNRKRDMSRRSRPNDDVSWESHESGERDFDVVENENRCSDHDDFWEEGRRYSGRESRGSHTRERGIRTIHRGRGADRAGSRLEIEHGSSHERGRETSVHRRKESAKEVDSHPQLDQPKNLVGPKQSHRLNYENKASKISISEMKEEPSLPPTPRLPPIPVLVDLPTERRQMETRVESKVSFKKTRSYSILRDEDDTVRRNASVLLPVLEDSERIFHELVASGDVHAIRMFLQDHPNFNINCVNYQKISALHVAVKQQNEAMVEFLLEQKALDLSDCALYAIKGGNIRIVEMILDKIREKSPGLEFAGTTHSVDFADDLTPLILAAQLGNYEMIDFLIKRDHSIPAVHPPFCKCEACKTDLKKYDRLRYSTMKLNLYKAICNPMYIFHTTDDPFQRAFELTKELQDAATVFPQFKVLFEELWMNLRCFTVDLIGCCRNSQEVEIVLKKSPRSVTNHVKFPRLQYAIDLKQKEFVSHPYTQAVCFRK